MTSDIEVPVRRCRWNESGPGCSRNCGTGKCWFEPPMGEKSAASEPDPGDRPAHYTAGDIECIDAIRAALTPEEFRGFCKGNVLKYVWRERHKGGDESLTKALDYIGYAKGEGQ